MISLACRDGGAWRTATAALHGAAAAAVLAWLGAPALVVAPAAALAAALAARRPPPAPTLDGDGRTWRLDGDRIDPPAIVLDLGGWMLLALPGRRWAPVSPAGAGPAWPALRAALYCIPSPLDRPEPARRP